MKDLTALDNVRMALILANERKSMKQRMGKKEMIQKSQYMLERLGMKDHMDQRASRVVRRTAAESGYCPGTGK